MTYVIFGLLIALFCVIRLRIKDAAHRSELARRKNDAAQPDITYDKPPRPSPPEVPVLTISDDWWDAPTKQTGSAKDAQSSKTREPDFILPENAEEIRGILKQLARDVIYFPRVFPPVHPMTSLSFFGGEPIGPADFVWPRDPEHNEPQLFMGQINLKDMPRTDLTEKLPDEGVLYFFARVEYERQVGTCIHRTGPTQTWENIPQPSDIPSTYTDNYKWNKCYTGRTPSFPKWEIKPTKALDYPQPDEYLFDAVLDGTPAAFEIFAQEQLSLRQETLDDVFGQRIAWPEGVNKDFQLGGAKADQALPQVWLSFELLLISLYGPNARNEHTRICKRARQLEERSRLYSPMDVIPDQDWNDFKRLQSKMKISENTWDNVVMMAIEYCLSFSAETAAMITPEQIGHVRHRHYGAAQKCGGFPPATQGHHIENDYDHYLLMHCDGLDRGQHWVFDAIIQFWIDKTDLQNGDLSSVFATLDN